MALLITYAVSLECVSSLRYGMIFAHMMLMDNQQIVIV